MANFGEWNRRGKPLNSDAITSSLRGRKEDFIASVVFNRRSNVVTVDAVRCKVEALCRCIMDDNFGTWHSEGCAIKVEVSEEASVRGELWLTA